MQEFLRLKPLDTSLRWYDELKSAYRMRHSTLFLSLPRIKIQRSIFILVIPTKVGIQ